MKIVYVLIVTFGFDIQGSGVTRGDFGSLAAQFRSHIGARLAQVLDGWTARQLTYPVDLQACIPSAASQKKTRHSPSSEQFTVDDYNAIAENLLARSRTSETLKKHSRAVERWTRWANTIGIPSTLQTQASTHDEKKLIVHIVKTYFAHLSLTLCDDKKNLGKAQSATIASYVSLIVLLHKTAHFQLEHDDYISDILRQLKEGRDSQLLDAGIPLHKPPRFASNIDLMVTMHRLRWNRNVNVSQKTYNSAIALITIAMLRPQDILKTTKPFNPLKDTTWAHLKWFRIKDNAEVPMTVTNLHLILRLRHAFIVIKRPLTKNSRSVPNPAPIVARIEQKETTWSPVLLIAEHCLEFLIKNRGKSIVLHETPLYTTRDSLSWLPYRLVHRIYKKRMAAALTIRDGKEPTKASLERWSTYSQKIYYKAALDAQDIHPEIIRQLGAWAPSAGDTPYSRLNEKRIHDTRMKITDSNDTFLELSWNEYQEGRKGNSTMGQERGHRDKSKQVGQGCLGNQPKRPKKHRHGQIEISRNLTSTPFAQI